MYELPDCNSVEPPDCNSVEPPEEHSLEHDSSTITRLGRQLQQTGGGKMVMGGGKGLQGVDL